MAPRFWKLTCAACASGSFEQLAPRSWIWPEPSLLEQASLIVPPQPSGPGLPARTSRTKPPYPSLLNPASSTRPELQMALRV
eukprot:8298193-Alexandrium_andersonii.AAC.1